LERYYALYEEFIMKGKECLLDYLGKKSEHPSWVSSEKGGTIESFSPSLTVCCRNSGRGPLFDMLDDINAIYYNEVWHRGSIMMYVGQLVNVEGNLEIVPTSHR
jgi:hypothetical protein